MKTALLGLLFLTSQAFAQAVEIKDNGESKAREYFSKRPKNEGQAAPTRRPSSEGATPRYLALHIGSFFTSQAYKWGHGEQGDKAKLNVGLTYRLGEWVNSLDLAMRVDYTTYDFPEGQARKLGVDFLFSFPDANSRFPLYFGAGIGPGFMIKQIADESILVLDYSLVAGARFLNVIDTMGFMIETGLKNHLHLLSDGQFNGVFLNVGTVFTF